MPSCRSCGKPVLWAVTEAGKRIPLDPEPSEHGNIVARNGKAHMAKKPIGFDMDETRWTSHFATCPDAGKWRKTN